MFVMNDGFGDEEDESTEKVDIVTENNEDTANKKKDGGEKKNDYDRQGE